jgi:LPXTG-motif cell wall-anchored protein
MSLGRIIGIALLVLGVVLIVLGLQASQSFFYQLSNAFTGKYTDNTMYYLIGGAAAALLGVLLLLFGRRR